MIRNLLAATAVATLVAAGTLAQETTTQPAQPAPTTPAPTEPMAPQTILEGKEHLATNFIGESVYNGTGEEAQNVGDVNDLVFEM